MFRTPDCKSGAFNLCGGWREVRFLHLPLGELSGKGYTVVSKSFNEWDNGASVNYVITRIEQQENKRFTWDKVFYKWSGFGPRPTFANHERWKICGKKNKLTGEFVA
jgi:hypothetical protein